MKRRHKTLRNLLGAGLLAAAVGTASVLPAQAGDPMDMKMMTSDLAGATETLAEQLTMFVRGNADTDEMMQGMQDASMFLDRLVILSRKHSKLLLGRMGRKGAMPSDLLDECMDGEMGSAGPEQLQRCELAADLGRIELALASMMSVMMMSEIDMAMHTLMPMGGEDTPDDEDAGGSGG